MHVTKLRASAEANGLVPAGRYFQHLAANLRSANAREHTRSARDDAEDLDLERLYRRASAARASTPFELAG